MSYQGSWKIDDLLTFYANTHRFDTGAATDADSVPSWRCYEDETGTPILTGTMALLDSANTAGFYSEQVTLSAANGFEKGKSYSIYISATVNSVTGTTHHTLQIEAEVDANIVSDKTGYSLSGTQTFNVTGNVTGNLSGSVGSVTGSVGSVTSGVTVTTNNDKAGYALSAAGIQAVWDALTSALATVGSIGKLLVDNINATISSRSSHSAADVWAVATRVLTAGTNIVLAKGTGVTGFNDLSAADIRTATGLASANLDTQLGAIDDFLDTEVLAIKAKTDNLPADPADASDIAASFSSLTTTLATIAGYIDTEVATIKGVTDKLDTTLEADGPAYRFTTNALEQAPAGGGGGTGLINFVYGGEWVLNQQNRIDFYLQSSAGAAVAGLGSGYILTLAKNGAAFAASAGTKAEIGSGWYTYLATAGEADTIGTIAAKAVGAGAVEQNLEYVVKQRTAGAISFTYTLTSTVTGLPIEGAIVWITTDLAGINTIWSGVTDAFGVARDSASGLPYLDPGTYYFFRQHGQFTSTNPDTEVVS